jgi:hypothetical protein
MMKGFRFFAFFLASLLLLSCQEDVEEPLPGTWDISWRDESGSLGGIIEFNDSQARIKAYGSPGSPFLHTYQEREYTWRFDGKELILIPLENDLSLNYRLIRQLPGRLEFEHLDGIIVVLQRR